ncbi:MAG: hypothetical protein AB7S65_02660 [Sulfuricurvum sp.]
MFRKIKHYFFSAFREIFVYHHNSLAFRAKTYAVLIASSNEPMEQYESELRAIATEIYDDPDRAGALVLTVREYYNAIHVKKSMTDEALLMEILKDIRLMPRYALKIESDHLTRLAQHTNNGDSVIYQNRLIEFLAHKRQEYKESRG